MAEANTKRQMSSAAPKSKKSAKSKATTPPPPSPKKSSKKKQLSKDTISDSESDAEPEKENEDSNSDDEEEDEEEEEITSSKPKIVNSISTFAPPESFAQLSTDSLPGTNPFSAKNLAGKELWFITAPASAPVTKLASVNPVDLAEGNPVLSTKSGRNFAMKPDEEDSDFSELHVLVANKDAQYAPAVKRITKSFTLSETLGQVHQMAEEDIPTKPVRPQPTGLRQRFRPMGADDAVAGDDAPVEDLMEIDHAPASGASKEERKKKRHKSSTGDDGEKKKKKKKKAVAEQ